MSDETPTAPVRRRGYRWVTSVLLVVVICVGVAGSVVGDTRPADVEISGCMAITSPGDAERPPRFRRIPCYFGDTDYAVLTSFAAADGHRCHDIPGTAVVYRMERKALCLGKRSIGPDAAINVATAGDCVHIYYIGRDMADPQRRDCADPSATHRVGRRLTNVPHTDLGRSVCRGVPDHATTYWWNWDGSGHRSKETVDVFLCLVNNRPDPPHRAGNREDLRTPCDYLTATQMGQVVTSVAGHRYTVRAREHDPTGYAVDTCLYMFTSGTDRIDISILPPANRMGLPPPPGGRQTVQEIPEWPAMGHFSSSQNEFLAVHHPAANVLIEFRLALSDDTLIRRIAVALFRAVALRLGHP